MDNTRAASAIDQIRQAHPTLRYAVYGCVTCGLIGLILGTFVGLRVHAPTAWAAAVEIGLPSAVFGTVIGALIGVVTTIIPTRSKSGSPN